MTNFQAVSYFSNYFRGTNWTYESPQSDFARDPETATSEIHPTLQKPPGSHLNTNELMTFWQDWDECWNREDLHALGDINKIQNTAYTEHASPYSADSSNKLCSQAAKNLNSHCPWSSEREMRGVHRLSVRHCCLTPESTVMDCNVQPSEIPGEF